MITTLTKKACTPSQRRLYSALLFGLFLLALSSTRSAAEVTAPTEGSHLSSQNNTLSTLASYNSTLQSYEAEGPYHQNASEVLYSLGLELQRGGQHSKALKSLRQAMHINRVNSGLNSLSQAPMLRGIINSQKNLMRFEPITASYHQLLRMHTASYGKHDPRLAPLLNELGLWHLDAYQFDKSSKRVDHLTAANSLVMSALKLSENQAKIKPREQIKLLRNAALINFYLSRHQGDEWTASTDSHYSLSADGFGTLNPQRTGILAGASFRRGRICHEKIIALTTANPGASLQEKIQAQVELADWYLLFNHKASAMALYQQVLTKIAASDQAGVLYTTLFATPRLLPAVRMESQPGKNGALLISAEVDISARGWGSHIEKVRQIQASEQDQKTDKNLHYLLVGIIKDSRFRPQFVDNKAISVSDVTVKIPLIH